VFVHMQENDVIVYFYATQLCSQMALTVGMVNQTHMNKVGA
jgi:hypothetical protein